MLEIEVRSSCLHGEYFIHRAVPNSEHSYLFSVSPSSPSHSITDPTAPNCTSIVSWCSANSVLPPSSHADSCFCILSCFLPVSSFAWVMVDSPFSFKSPPLDCLHDHNCLPPRPEKRSFQSPVGLSGFRHVYIVF